MILANRFLASPWAGETVWKKVEQSRINTAARPTYSQRSESPRFREESLHLGMRAAVDQVL